MTVPTNWSDGTWYHVYQQQQEDKNIVTAIKKTGPQPCFPVWLSSHTTCIVNTARPSQFVDNTARCSLITALNWVTEILPRDGRTDVGNKRVKEGQQEVRTRDVQVTGIPMGPIGFPCAIHGNGKKNGIIEWGWEGMGLLLYLKLNNLSIKCYLLSRLYS